MKDLSSLQDNTKEVLLKLSDLELVKDYVFVGGSALSLYLNHRKSEDIDLFTWNENINRELIINTIKEVFGENFKIENISQKQIDLNVNHVKVTFFANKWKELQNADETINNLKIAPLHLLTAMKINVLFLRAKFRDYYDLYVINKEKYGINKMYEIAAEYIPQINEKLFQMALIYTDDIADDNIKHLEPKYNIDLKKIQLHFEKEIKKMVNMKKK